MVNNLTVAWATPIDAVELGASIETHALVKATMSAFHEFIKDEPETSAVKKLAPKLLDIISTHLRQSAYEEHEEEWGKSWLCFYGVCTPSNHQREKDYDFIKALYLSKHGESTAEECGGPEFNEEHFERWLWERQSRTRADNKHHDNIKTLERKIIVGPGRRNYDTKFADVRKMFSEDYGLDIHFQVHHKEASDHDPWMLRTKDLGDRSFEAYLILPAEYGIMNLGSLPRSTALDATILIDPLTRHAASDDQKALFKTAMAELNLELKWNFDWRYTGPQPTSERYRKSRRELATIENEEAEEGQGYHERFGEALEERLSKLKAMEWPQFIVFSSGTHDPQP